jgi:hypothetical protein
MAAQLHAFAVCCAVCVAEQSERPLPADFAERQLGGMRADTPSCATCGSHYSPVIVERIGDHERSTFAIDARIVWRQMRPHEHRGPWRAFQCSYAKRDRDCRHGGPATCQFWHHAWDRRASVAAAAAASTPPSAPRKKTRRPRAPAPAPADGAVESPACRAWIRSGYVRCPRGDGCRFEHDAHPTTVIPAAVGASEWADMTDA